MVRRDPILLDLALDLLVPPLATIAGVTFAGLVAARLASAALGTGLIVFWLWVASAVALGVYLLRGWWISGTGLAGLLALARAPAYVLWKISLALGRRGASARDWVRTTRERS